jgi:putative heme-binding domain-containing protein
VMTSPLPFGEFHVITVTCEPGKEGVRLFVDGKPAGQRPREPGMLRVDHLLLGARCYSNTSEPPHVSGFLDGDIAEVLLCDRVLTEKELRAVHDYLARKHADLGQALAAADHQRGHLLKPLADPPPVQMLVPGFAVRQLPVDLTNINNLRYRDDGKLVALAYSGNIYLLSDTDGDGLEDKVELFWEAKGRLRGPIGMALTPPGYKHGKGVFVPSKGKLSLIVDTDGDDQADKEIIVAEGWKEIPQNVDALGVAVAKDGSIYFGLGTANFANGYLLDGQGKAAYDLASERGTILKVAPDFSKREIVCTGVRFPVALAFNRHGDLFASDQEGATWLPNGNPFDELLHIQPGRHYGFPPRHPKHLPNVIDEPSVFDYGPQHQSTCGLIFNEPVNGGPVFGPASWAGDALVCGESRGKLYRTKLVKTENGYIAQNHLLACLNMLTVDACVSPKGDLVVAVHSGPPDWGTGPLGKGKLYKITYRHKEAPQPVLAWAAGPREVRIAFDRPLDPLQLQNLTKQVSIEYGPYVHPGDRFEVLRPPYAVVQQQLATPRHTLPVLSAQVTPDRRTLILATGPHPEAVHYAITLPGLGRSTGKGELPQHASIDLGYDLGGVEVTWRASNSGANWHGWLPHLDLKVARELTAGSAEHDEFWKLVSQPGRLTLRTRLDLNQMLRPAIQPGSKLDYTPSREHVALTFSSRRSRISITGVAQRASSVGMAPVVEEGQLLPVDILLEADRGEPDLEVVWKTEEDDRARPLPLRRFLVPWASTKPQPTELATARTVPELQGGDWLRGREVYFSDVAACSKCHTLRGQGGQIGPDLSNLIHRDYASVLRDIIEPSAALNPEHLSYVVELKDGRVLTGALRSAGEDKLVLGDSEGKEQTLSKGQIAAMQPSSISVMPKDVDKALGPDKMRDLLTFLLTEPLQPAPLERKDAPPPRSRAEVDAILKTISPPKEPGKKRHIVLVAGPKDHGPGEHDYPLWQRRWLSLLSLSPGIKVSTATGWPTPGQLESADVIAFYSANPNWTAEKGAELDTFLKRGGGLVFLHWAVNGRKDAEALAERIGLAGRAGMRYRHGPLELTFAEKHPITHGFSKVRFVDESYWQMIGDPKKINVLATGVEEGQPRPLLWTYERGKGRVFVSILGHYTWTFDDPLFRILVLRGLAWAAGEPVDRWIELATVGARIGE